MYCLSRVWYLKARLLTKKRKERAASPKRQTHWQRGSKLWWCGAHTELEGFKGMCITTVIVIIITPTTMMVMTLVIDIITIISINIVSVVVI